MASLAVLALHPVPILHDIAPWLDEAQSARLAQIAHPARELQFRAARHLAIGVLQNQGVSPQLLVQASGRPQAKHWPAIDGLSWSHTLHWAAAALGLGRVGVDIETIRPRRSILTIAQQYFSADESRYLLELPVADQLRMFFILWVAKEALLKALGTGLVGGLDRFELLCHQGRWQLKSADQGVWYLQVWQLGNDTLCAVASDTAQSWQLDGIAAELILQAVS